MTVRRAMATALLTAAALRVCASAPADPSGYLKPEGDEKTVEKAARVFRDGVRALDIEAAGTALAKFRRAASLCPDFFEARYNVAKLEGVEYGRDRAIEGLFGCPDVAQCIDLRPAQAVAGLGVARVEH
jgi:hypothetical protein